MREAWLLSLVLHVLLSTETEVTRENQQMMWSEPKKTKKKKEVLSHFPMDKALLCVGEDLCAYSLTTEAIFLFLLFWSYHGFSDLLLSALELLFLRPKSRHLVAGTKPWLATARQLPPTYCIINPVLREIILLITHLLCPSLKKNFKWIISHIPWHLRGKVTKFCFKHHLNPTSNSVIPNISYSTTVLKYCHCYCCHFHWS